MVKMFSHPTTGKVDRCLPNFFRLLSSTVPYVEKSSALTIKQIIAQFLTQIQLLETAFSESIVIAEGDVGKRQTRARCGVLNTIKKITNYQILPYNNFIK